VASVNSEDLKVLEFVFASGCPRTTLLETPSIICAIAMQQSIEIVNLFLELEATKTKADGKPAVLNIVRSLSDDPYDSAPEEQVTSRICSQYLLEMVLIEGNNKLMKYLLEERGILLDEDMIKRHLLSRKALEMLDYLLKHFQPGITPAIVEAAYRSGIEAKINAVQSYISQTPSLLTIQALEAIEHARDAAARQYSNWWAHYEYNAYPGVPWETGEVIRTQLEYQQQVIRQLQQALHTSLPIPTDNAVQDGLNRALEVAAREKKQMKDS